MGRSEESFPRRFSAAVWGNPPSPCLASMRELWYNTFLLRAVYPVRLRTWGDPVTGLCTHWLIEPTEFDLRSELPPLGGSDRNEMRHRVITTPDPVVKILFSPPLVSASKWRFFLQGLRFHRTLPFFRERQGARDQISLSDRLGVLTGHCATRLGRGLRGAGLALSSSSGRR